MRILLIVLIFASCTLERREAPDADVEMNVGDQTGGDTVLVRISAPRTASVGDVVPITVVLQNNRERSIDLHLTGREIVYDIVIARANKSIVWQRLNPNATTQSIVQLKTLGPGESFTLTDNWTASEPGSFVIGAELPTDAQPLQAAPVGITIRQ
jgi:hypothetical protein